MKFSLWIFMFGTLLSLHVISARPQNDFIFDNDYSEPVRRPIRPNGSSRPNRPSRPIPNYDYGNFGNFNNDYSDADYNVFTQKPSTTRPNRPSRPKPTRPPMVITEVTTAAPQPTRPSNCEANCLTTGQYNPVCGSDGQTYNNIGRLECAQRCGKRVSMRIYGRCAPILPGLQQIKRWR